MNKKLVGGIVAVVVGVAVIANLPSDKEPEAAPTTQVTTIAPSPSFTEQDLTADLQEAAPDQADLVTAATVTEPGRLQIDTTIVDDRDNGGDDADDALALCNAGLTLLDVDDPYVAVMEEDGTHFVIAGHPSYGNECTEIP